MSKILKTIEELKDIIIPKTTVAGNIRDFNQSYEIFYYPKAEDLPDKVAVYIYLTNENKSFAKRSLFFSSHEQLKEYIFDLVKAYFVLRDKRITPVIPLSEYRKISLSSLLENLEQRQLALWSLRK